MLKKRGCKPQLPPKEARALRAEYATYQRRMRRALEVAPSVLARKYRISPRTVIDYGRNRHKGRANYALAPRQQRLCVR